MLFNKVLEKKRQHLFDLNVEGKFLCFAGNLMYLLDNNASTNQEIVTRARERHKKPQYIYTKNGEGNRFLF